MSPVSPENTLQGAVIIDAVWTPIGKGKPAGSLSSVLPVDLLAHTLGALARRTAIDPSLIDYVVGGCVDQVGEQARSTTAPPRCCGWAAPALQATRTQLLR